MFRHGGEYCYYGNHSLDYSGNPADFYYRLQSLSVFGLSYVVYRRIEIGKDDDGIAVCIENIPIYPNQVVFG